MQWLLWGWKCKKTTGWRSGCDGNKKTRVVFIHSENLLSGNNLPALGLVCQCYSNHILFLPPSLYFTCSSGFQCRHDFQRQDIYKMQWRLRDCKQDNGIDKEKGSSFGFEVVVVANTKQPRLLRPGGGLPAVINKISLH